MNSSFFSLSLSYVTNNSPFFCSVTNNGKYIKTVFKNFHFSKSFSSFFHSNFLKSSKLLFSNARFSNILDVPIQIEESNLYKSYISNHLNLTDSEVNIEQCIFQNIHTHYKGAPFYISTFSGSVNISYTTILNCTADLGSAGGQILSNVCRLKSVCCSLCCTDEYEKIQSIDVNCKKADVSQIQISKCSSDELPSIGVTVFQFKCSYSPMTIEYINITRNVMHGSGYTFREIDTQNCLAKYANIAENNDNGRGVLIGESETPINMMICNFNIINNTVNTLLSFETSTNEPQEKQIYDCIFRDNSYNIFLKQRHMIPMIIDNCIFDLDQNEFEDEIFQNCTFNQSDIVILDIPGFSCVSVLYPDENNNTGLSTTELVLIGCSCGIFAVALISIIACYCFKRKHKKELSFTDQYFRSFVNE